MGAWGVRLYQNDVGDDVRHHYKEQLRYGKTGKEITQMLIAENSGILNDEDDAPDFWFALADTQWTLGRLEDGVREKALLFIENGFGLRRWQEEAPHLVKERKRVLNDLREKLHSPQPPPKKISQYRLYKCQWKIGDVYAYPLESELAYKNSIGGEFFLFHKVGENTCHPGHIIPIVRVKITKNGILPRTLEEFDQLDYVQVSQVLTLEAIFGYGGGMYVNGQPVGKYVKNKYGEVPIYCMELYNTSKRIIPKNLVYVGNHTDIRCPVIEFIPSQINYPGFMWKFFDRIMIDRYYAFNARDRSEPHGTD